jgi:hypothetical protein
MFWMIFSIFVFIAGLLDAYKSRFLTKKILRYKSSKGASRTFNNISIVYKVFLSLYAIFHLHDWVVTICSLVALYTAIELWWVTYLNYNYIGRGRFGFKRPHPLYYLWNSLLPNSIAKRL